MMPFNLPTNSLFTTEQQRELMKARPDCEYRMVQTVALQDFKDHPYRVEEGEEMYRLLKSVKERGILNPLIVRDAPNMMYEVLAGHRRKYAAEFNSLDMVPALVYHNMSDEDATIIMVDSNLNREHILPSERAFAYRMKADAVRKKIAEGSEDEEEIAGRVNDNIDEEQSRRTVEAYMRLTYLTRELLDLVDAGQIPVYAGVNLSFLSIENQIAIYSWISDPENMKKPKINLKQAEKLRLSQAEGGEPDGAVKLLTEQDIRDVMLSKKHQKGGKLAISFAELEPFIPGISTRKHGKKNNAAVIDYIMQAVRFYQDHAPDQEVPGVEEEKLFDEG